MEELALIVNVLLILTPIILFIVSFLYLMGHFPLTLYVKNITAKKIKKVSLFRKYMGISNMVISISFFLMSLLYVFYPKYMNISIYNYMTLLLIIVVFISRKVIKKKFLD